MRKIKNPARPTSRKKKIQPDLPKEKKILPCQTIKNAKNKNNKKR